VLVTNQVAPDGVALAERAAGAGAFVGLVDEGTLAAVAEAEHPQGMVAGVAYQPAPLAALRQVDVAVVLDGLAEPGNVGAVIRTAAAVGAGAVVTTAGTADPMHPRAVRASAGTLFALPVVADCPVADLVGMLWECQLPRIVADPAGETVIPTALPRFALVMGGEARGPSPVLRDGAERIVTLPMEPPVESLNVGVAAAVLLYALRGLVP
jgi:RNA methyltransferase, TrmH family